MTERSHVLQTILASTRKRVARSSVQDQDTATPRLPRMTSGPNDVLEALRANAGRAVIAEIKMGSPRLGRLEARIDPIRQAELYARAGATALSVVVEPDHFFGSYELLDRCRRASGLPAIAKDFVVDARQVEWAHRAGAGAVLLIAATLDGRKLQEIAAATRRLGLVPLVEVHDREDLAKLGAAGAAEEWELVGVNNRDLRTFDVDLERSIALVPELPRGALRVSESGIRSEGDLVRLSAAGFDAFLVGEALLLADDPETLLRQLAGR
ncbi:MAG TPA: indole-3-glycerol phosphate synthase TrpC [Thermoanaerobaculia bacterium]|nr:indole-3-glycerol phosphate synthase TrpC [Thermoanaerobaculia bacterium]